MNPVPTPPNWPLRFLSWFCPDQLLEEIEGDLFQKFEKDVDLFGINRAKRRLVWNVIRYFRPGILLRNRTNTINIMIITHLKFALRTLSRNKAFTIVNIFGLTLSMASCILVIEYAHFEKSYDKFFTQHDKIFRIHHSRYVDSELLYKKAMTFPEVGLAMKDYFPEIEQVTRLFPASLNIEPVFAAITDTGERKSFSEPNVYLADSAFTKVFDLNFIHGDPASALSGKDKAIISQSTAMRYFERTDVVGEILHGNVKDVVITGVFEDLPKSTHLEFDILWSWFDVYGERSRYTWDGFYTYILLKNGSDIKNIDQHLLEFANAYMGAYYENQPGNYSRFESQPLDEIHLQSHLEGEMGVNGNANIVYTLLVVTCLIIVIATINHVNLNASRSLGRVKEVGIRKIIGSSKTQLTIQFLFESLIVNLIALALALTCAWMIYPTFNELFHTKVILSLWFEPVFWLIVLGFILTVSIISGFYPAFILTRFKVHEAIKGLTFGITKSRSQNALVTVQFTLSLILIVGSYVVFEQIRYMQNKDLGFGSRLKLVVKILPGLGDESDSTFVQKMEAIRTKALSYPFIKHSSISSSIPGRENEWRGRTRLVGENTEPLVANLTRVDENFVNTFDLKLIVGRDYTSSSHNENSVIINEEAAKQLGFQKPEDALGAKIVMFRDREVIGVLKSFHEVGLHEAISPSLFITGEGYTKFLTIALAEGNTPRQIEAIQKIWKEYFPDKPFQYFFLDDYFNKQYQADVQMGRSISLFSSLAVLLGCLGLFSLSIHTIHRRTKEIGIRKLLGATIPNITRGLCWSVISPIGIAAVAGVTVSFYFAKWWLEQYAFQIELAPHLFLGPLVVLFLISLLTILFQSIKAARKNPVECLRYE